MGVFAYIKNGVKYKTNQFPGAYPANRVSYNGSDVETALDELNADITKHTLGTTVNITNGYDTTPFIVPADGYVSLINNAGASGLVTIGAINIGGVQGAYALFVKKGMSVIVGTGTSLTRYIPLV